MNRTSSLLSCLSILAVGWGCAWTTMLSPPGCPVALVPSAELLVLPPLRARVAMTVSEREIGFELVTGHRDDAFIVVGLAPHGVRLFSVAQRGVELEFDAPGAGLRRVGSHALDALHRAYFIRSGPFLAPNEDRTFAWQQEVVRDTSTASEVHRREYADTALGVARVTIDYREQATGVVGSGFTIRNRRCGYDAVVVELSSQQRGGPP